MINASFGSGRRGRIEEAKKKNGKNPFCHGEEKKRKPPLLN